MGVVVGVRIEIVVRVVVVVGVVGSVVGVGVGVVVGPLYVKRVEMSVTVSRRRGTKNGRKQRMLNETNRKITLQALEGIQMSYKCHTNAT